MKASKFSDAQKAFILKQGADGVPVAEICRKDPPGKPFQSQAVTSPCTDGADHTFENSSRRARIEHLVGQKLLLLRVLLFQRPSVAWPRSEGSRSHNSGASALLSRCLLDRALAKPTRG